MKFRCYNKKSKDYYRYGERGIQVSKEWKNFNRFYLDIGPRPSINHTLERKDNNGNYCKENCIWLVKEEQSFNRENNIRIEWNGQIKCLGEWAKILQLKYDTLLKRYNSGIKPPTLFNPIRNYTNKT